MIELTTVPRHPDPGDFRVPLWDAWSDDKVTCSVRKGEFVMAVGNSAGNLRLSDTLVGRANGKNLGRVSIGDRIKVDGTVYEITEHQATYPLVKV